MDWRRVTKYWLRSRILWILKCLLEMHKYKAKHFWKNVGISSLLLINYNWWWPMPITTQRSIMDTKVAFFKGPIIFFFDDRCPLRHKHDLFKYLLPWLNCSIKSIEMRVKNNSVLLSGRYLISPGRIQFAQHFLIANTYYLISPGQN